MEKRHADVLKTILVKGESRPREIVEEIMRKCSWNLDEDSTKVTVSNILKQLLKDYLRKTTKAHMDVRYDFRSENAREKARILVFTQSSEELKKTMRDIVEKDPGAVEVLLLVPILTSWALSSFLSKSGKIGAVENLRFYKKRTLEVIDTLYDVFLEFCEDHSIKKEFWFGDETGDAVAQMFSDETINEVENDSIFSQLTSRDKKTAKRFELVLKVVLSMDGIAQLMKRKAESLKRLHLDDNKGRKESSDS